jgi:hypothetical protein
MSVVHAIDIRFHELEACRKHVAGGEVPAFPGRPTSRRRNLRGGASGRTEGHHHLLHLHCLLHGST